MEDRTKNIIKLTRVKLITLISSAAKRLRNYCVEAVCLFVCVSVYLCV